MSSPDESPLHIYHSTKDANGDRRFTRLVLPAELLSELERFLRENGTFLSVHQMLLNAVHYGLKAMQEYGLAPSSVVFEHSLEAQHLLTMQEAQVKLYDSLKQAWRDATTPDQRANVSSKILGIAATTTDPQIAHQLRQILD